MNGMRHATKERKSSLKSSKDDFADKKREYPFPSPHLPHHIVIHVANKCDKQRLAQTVTLIRIKLEHLSAYFRRQSCRCQWTEMRLRVVPSCESTMQILEPAFSALPCADQANARRPSLTTRGNKRSSQVPFASIGGGAGALTRVFFLTWAERIAIALRVPPLCLAFLSCRPFVSAHRHAFTHCVRSCALRKRSPCVLLTHLSPLSFSSSLIFNQLWAPLCGETKDKMVSGRITLLFKIECYGGGMRTRAV